MRCELYKSQGRDTYLQFNVRHLLSLKQCVDKRAEIRMGIPNMVFEMARKAFATVCCAWRIDAVDPSRV